MFQRRHADRIAPVIRTERLSSVVLWLERVAGGELPPPVTATLEAVAAECERVERALAAHRAPERPWVGFPGEEALDAAPGHPPKLKDVQWLRRNASIRRAMDAFIHPRVNAQRRPCRSAALRALPLRWAPGRSSHHPRPSSELRGGHNSVITEGQFSVVIEIAGASDDLSHRHVRRQGWVRTRHAETGAGHSGRPASASRGSESGPVSGRGLFFGIQPEIVLDMMVNQLYHHP